MTPVMRATGRMVVVLLAMAGAPQVSAQQPPPVKFEVASVKRSADDAAASVIRAVAGQFQTVNIPLRVIIQQAAQVAPELIVAPEWTRTERYDVTAKIPSTVQMGPGVMPAMLRALLEERFHMVVRWETRELPLYHLVRAREDGPVPRGLNAPSPQCPADQRGEPPPDCGTLAGFGSLTAGNMPMEQLARLLSGRLGRQVVDRTGLRGNYRFALKYTPDRSAAPDALAAAPAPADADAPPLLTAVQEQLGLKLEPARGPVEVFVVDRIDRPTAD